jgi:hypothetical protein
VPDIKTSKRRLKPIGLREVSAALLVTVMLTSGLLSCSPRPSEPAPIRVVGNLLEAGGKRWITRGVVDYVLPFYAAQSGKADSTLRSFTDADYRERIRIFAAMQRDGVNTVRIPLALSEYKNDVYSLGGTKGYMQRLLSTIRAAEASGLRIILCWWDSLGWGKQLTGRYKSLFSMMSAVEKALGDDPSVLYEPYNEPNGINWVMWQKIMIATIREWRTVIGYRGPLILDTIAYSWAFAPQRATILEKLDSVLLGRHSQLVFANHRYPDEDTCFCGNNESAWTRSVERWVTAYPILGTEYGLFVDGFSAQPRWMMQFSSFLFSSAIPTGLNGAVFFVWSWVDPNSLTSGNHVTLSVYGKSVLRNAWPHA